MRDKFKLYKSKQFKIAQRHNVPLKLVKEKTEPFTYKLDCGCVDEFEPGWYKWLCFYGYVKLENL